MEGPREVLAFPWGLPSIYPCGESHDRDEAERNRGALHNCGRRRQRMWRKPRPRWSEAESRCVAQLRPEPRAHVAKATTEMERSEIEVRCTIAAGAESACGESHDRDGAERNRGALHNCGRNKISVSCLNIYFEPKNSRICPSMIFISLWRASTVAQAI